MMKNISHKSPALLVVTLQRVKTSITLKTIRRQSGAMYI